MEVKIAEALKKWGVENQLQNLSPQEALEHFKHIELTEEEKATALLQAKMRKELILKQQEVERRAEENRRALTGTRWSYEQTDQFMRYRATQIFTDPEKPFRIDSHNQLVFELLCYYFSHDQRFEAVAANAGIKNPSLSKGILLAGNFGTGKSWLMKLFQKNQRQTFFMREAKKISDEYQADGVQAAATYEGLFKNPINDHRVFFQPYSGLCVDDIGAEDVKKHMGNARNVIGDLIENRYSKGHVGDMLHGTTNLTSAKIQEYYGGRVVSRMREIFNFIELPGQDRRV